MSLNNRVLAAVTTSYQQHAIVNLCQGRPIYIACSGGRDSMALLWACYLQNLYIHVIHINHQLQTANDDWQAMVEQFCQHHNIAFSSVKIAWSQQQSSINEQQARQARYQAITQIVGRDAVVAVAHHADDQAETILLNLCQGTGLSGLSGMSALSHQAEFGTPIYLWRPLLSLTREQITAFIISAQVPYIDDPTNIGVHNRRAWLRQTILPSLKQEFTGLVANINRTSQNITDAKSIVHQQATHAIKDSQKLQAPWTVTQQGLAIEQLQNYSQAELLSLLHYWIKGDEKFAPSRDFCERVYALIYSDNKEQQAKLVWQGTTIRRYRQVLYRLDRYYHEAASQLAMPSVLLNILTLAAEQQITSNNAAQDLPQLLKQVSCRQPMPKESFQRLNCYFHESFKKLCQRFAIPSWERHLATVVIIQRGEINRCIALILPGYVIWLKDSSNLGYSLQQPYQRWQMVAGNIAFI